MSMTACEKKYKSVQESLIQEALDLKKKIVDSEIELKQYTHFLDSQTRAMDTTIISLESQREANALKAERLFNLNLMIRARKVHEALTELQRFVLYGRDRK